MLIFSFTMRKISRIPPQIFRDRTKTRCVHFILLFDAVAVIINQFQLNDLASIQDLRYDDSLVGSVHIEQSYQGMINSEDVDRYQRDQVSSDGGDVFIETDIEVGNSIVFSLEHYYVFDRCCFRLPKRAQKNIRRLVKRSLWTKLDCLYIEIDISITFLLILIIVPFMFPVMYMKDVSCLFSLHPPK